MDGHNRISPHRNIAIKNDGRTDIYDCFSYLEPFIKKILDLSTYFACRNDMTNCFTYLNNVYNMNLFTKSSTTQIVSNLFIFFIFILIFLLVKIKLLFLLEFDSSSIKYPDINLLPLV